LGNYVAVLFFYIYPRKSNATTFPTRWLISTGWAIIVTLLLAMPCIAANPADLVGYWVNEETNGIYNMELLGNGRGTFGGIAISWEANKNVFVIYTPKKETYYYQISGSVFVLIDGAMRIPFVKVTKAEFTKKLKEAEEKKVELAKKSKEIEEQKKKDEEKLKEEERKRIEKLSSYFTDSRDGKKYRSVQIGTQTWSLNMMSVPLTNSVFRL